MCLEKEKATLANLAALHHGSVRWYHLSLNVAFLASLQDPSTEMGISDLEQQSAE
jgi:hypothetical protein